jgi:inorganic pyrophosphatase
MVYNIKEMKRVEKISPDGPVTVIALLDPTNELPTQAYVIDPGDVDNRLITEAQLIGAVRKNEKGRVRTNIVVAPTIDKPDIEVTRVNTGNPKILSELITKFFEDFPADHHMIVLSGHGSGAEQDFLLKDEGAGDALTIKEISEAIRTVKRNLQRKDPDSTIDIVGMDSCLMSMAEVYYQLGNIESEEPDGYSNDSHNLTDFLIGAEGFSPNTGWPYQRILETLTGDPEMEPEAFSRKIVETYINYYADYSLAGLSVDIAACDLRGDKCVKLKRKIKTLAQKLTRGLSNEKVRDEIIMAHWEAQAYKFDRYTDITDFCNLLIKRLKKYDKQYTETIDACEEIVDIVREIVKKSCYSGPSVQYSYGLSVYFPWDRVHSAYGNLDFAQGTGWDKFLQAYVEKTRREPRKQCKISKKEQHSVKAQLFHPVFNGIVTENSSFPAGIKFVLPENEGVSGFGGNTKNPPIKWCPCDCTDEPEQINSVEETGNAASNKKKNNKYSPSRQPEKKPGR